MKKKLFGTDGIRGKANREVTAQLAYKVGRVCTYVLYRRLGRYPRILVGKDTRLSGDMLESAITAGICSAGGTAAVAGVIPTPAVAYAVVMEQQDAGIVISASHNPFYDNGIKIFDHRGHKLGINIENEIEDVIANGYGQIENPAADKIGKRISFQGFLDPYLDSLVSSVSGTDFSKIKFVIDCANGSTSHAVAQLMGKLGAKPMLINNEPNGININLNCGSTCMEPLGAAVREKQALIGIAYDGDGDRCLVVDENGIPLDGDEILTICSIYMKSKGSLNQNGFAATIMSNPGLFEMGRRQSILIDRAPVGDKHVAALMRQKGYNLGGESSGHTLFLDYSTTSDGMLTSLQILKILVETGKPLSQLKTQMTRKPQIVINAKVPQERKHLLKETPHLYQAVQAFEARFSEQGRAFVRPSGTEALIRITVEGGDEQEMVLEAQKLKIRIEKELG